MNDFPPHSLSRRDRSRGELLRAARRVDWRFLLPRPELGRVAYLGRDDPKLVNALVRFADELVDDTNDGPVAQSVKFDVVVLGSPTRDECSRARRLLRPGGWVYAEIDGLLVRRRRRAGSLRAPSTAARTLLRLGFSDLAAFWHWPDFDACTQIIPLSDSEAARYVLERRRKERGRSIETLLARGLLAAGVLSWSVPHSSVIARSPER